MKLFRFLLPLFLLLPARAVSAQEAKWLQSSSEHFLLFTDTNEAKAQRLLTDLEQRFAGFKSTLGSLRQRQFPIEVFLFKNRDDFVAAIPPQPPVNGSTPPEKNAYLLAGTDRWFIVAKDKSPEDIANDVGHALGHVLFEHEVVWRPFWLAEGMAEYVRKMGKNADTKDVSQKDAETVADLLTIVPSATYRDADPPTAFRTQAYRLLRVVSRDNPQALRDFVTAINREDGKTATLNVDVSDLQKQFDDYSDTPLVIPPVAPAVKTVAADQSALTIHRGDLLLAAGRTYDASRYYNGTSPEARAARAIVTATTRPVAESIPALTRAAQELPENGLVQYHFGAIENTNAKSFDAQVAALERATKLLPAFGRAYAELARVYALTGKAEQSLPLLDKALQLEPEFADRFYEIRSQALVALNRFEDSLAAIKTAESLPHLDRKVVESYTVKVMEMTRKIEMARRAVDAEKTDRIRRNLEVKVNEREPVKPPPPPVVVPEGSISYEISATSVIEVVDAIYPEYPEPLRRQNKSGRITLRVEVGPDGKVRNAVVGNSQISELNAATIEAAKKWTFKLPARPRPAPVNITLIFNYTLIQ